MVRGSTSIKDRCRNHGPILRRVVFHFSNSVKLYQNPMLIICNKHLTCNSLIGFVLVKLYFLVGINLVMLHITTTNIILQKSSNLNLTTSELCDLLVYFLLPLISLALNLFWEALIYCKQGKNNDTTKGLI